MQTLDLRKTYKHLYNPSAKQPVIVDVPPLQFVSVVGAIEPGQSPGVSPTFAVALEALYGISYTLKFMCKQRPEDPVDYPVMPLEALWWVKDGQFDIRRPDNWHWRAMIMQPEVITPALFAEGLDKLRRKRGDQPAFDLLRLEPFHEGLAVQVMHIGPYSDEPATLERMHVFAAANGYRLHYDHHEIYLGDPRRADPAKLKTVLRHPVEKVAVAV